MMKTDQRPFFRRAEDSLPVGVVYEDSATHVRALQIYDYLLAHAGSEIEFQFSWWSFDLLQETRRAENAARIAEAADLVIFSTRRGGELPPEVTAWIESWVARRAGRSGAIAALFSPPRAETAGAGGRRAYLQNVAKSAGMDFLAHEAEPMLTIYFAELDELVHHTAPLVHHAAPLVLLYQDAFDRPDSSPYWGVNG